MENINDYISILIESLNKKVVILDDILKENENQKLAVSSEKMNEELFDQTIDSKEKLIKKLNELDTGFDAIYSRIKDDIVVHAERYSEEIKTLKGLISTITEKSMEVQISEKRNEQLVEKSFKNLRKEARKTKAANQAASDYYKNMSNTTVVEPQFVDKKK